MILDPSQIPSREIYRFMISAVVPRPIAFVSTVDSGGRFNVAPFSFFTAIGSAPPLLGISINLRRGEPKHTLANIRATGDFVVNVVNEDLAERMVQASGDWPQEVSEFDLTGLTPVASDLVKAPRVGESPVNFECRAYREIELGMTFFVIGEIVRVHADERVLTDGRVDVAKLKPIARLGGAQYALVHEVVEMQRPKVDPQV